MIVFDFDGTLTKDDTFLSFPRFAMKRGLMSRGRLIRGMVKSLPAIIQWKMGRISNSEAKERMTANLYEGLDKDKLMKLAEDYNPQWRLEILAQLENYRRNGEEIWIISASLDIWMRPIAERLGVKLLCTETATTPNGLLTGRFSTPNCHGEEKVRRLREVKGDLANSTLIAYGDEPDGGDAAIRRIAREFHKV